MNETGVRPPILQFTGGNVSGNNNVWRKFQFSSITTTKIRVLSNASPDGYSRLTEVEAWGNDVSTNVALSGNGAAASASSIFSSGYPASGAVDGDRRGANWGSGGGWNDAAPGNTFPDWLEVDFSGSKTISEIDVFTEQDNYSSPSEPTETMTFSSYGLSGYEVQYWNGSVWADVTGGNVSGNNNVWRKFQFSSITTSKIRVLTNASADGYSRITELEAWTLPTSTVGPINYVLSDIQGSTRAVMSNNGSSSAIIARHDYLPFGEELSSGLGLRSSSQGYGATDRNRQKYGLTERDDATGLDHTWFRKYENLSGRWTSPDPYTGSASIADPQSFHRYNYTQNDPVNFVDPSGLESSWNCQWTDHGWDCGGVGVVTVRTSWADEISADTGGPPEFGSIIWRGGDPLGPGGSPHPAPTPSRQTNCGVNPLLVPLDSDTKIALLNTNVHPLFAPDFAKAFSGVVRELNALGITPMVTSGFRTPADQTRMRQGGSGSNPAATVSFHQSGWAVDVNTLTSDFSSIRRTFEKDGFSWGGNFRPKPDRPHFEMNPFGPKGTNQYKTNVRQAANSALDFYKNCLGGK